MIDMTILSSPVPILLFGAALLVTLIGKLYRKSAALEWAAAFLTAGAAAVSEILGVSLRETAAVIVVLILVHLIGMRREER